MLNVFVNVCRRLSLQNTSVWKNLIAYPEPDSFLQKGPKTDSFDITWYISYKFVLIRVNSYMCRRERLRSSFTLTLRGLVDPHLCRQQYMRRNPKARASSNEGVVDKLELKLSVLGQT